MPHHTPDLPPPFSHEEVRTADLVPSAPPNHSPSPFHSDTLSVTTDHTVPPALPDHDRGMHGSEDIESCSPDRLPASNTDWFSTDHRLPPTYPNPTRPEARTGPIDRGEIFAEDASLGQPTPPVHAAALIVGYSLTTASHGPIEPREPDQVLPTRHEEHQEPEPGNRGGDNKLPPPPADHAGEAGEGEESEPGEPMRRQEEAEALSVERHSQSVEGTGGQGDRVEVTNEIVDPLELGDSIHSEIRSRCIEEVRRGVEEIRTLIAAGTFDESEYDGDPIGYIVKDMAVEAAKRGDQSQAEADVDLLAQLPGANNHVIVEACHATIAATDSLHAFDVLSGLLKTERLKTIEAIAYLMESTPDILRPHLSFVALEGLIMACEDNGTSPDTWINKYAIDAEHRWKLYFAHYLRMAEPGMPDVEANQAELDRMVSEFAGDTAFDHAFIYDETPYLLNVVKRPDLRAQLLRRYKRASAEVPINLTRFSQYVSVANAILIDPLLAMQENVAYLESTIDTFVEALRRSGTDDLDLTQHQLPWSLALKWYRGATPQQLIDYLDLQTSQMLIAITDIPESPQASKYIDFNQESVLVVRDELLANWAANSAEVGDFISTQVFISNIGNDVSQKYALNKCLSHVTTQEQIEMIRPDEVTLMVNPELHMQFRVAEALIGGDLDTLFSLAVEAAGTINESNSSITLGNIKRMYDAIAERGGGIELARKMAATMRRLGVEFYAQDYSEALIRAGDPEELRITYEDINNDQSDASWRLLRLWRFAQVLAEQ